MIWKLCLLAALLCGLAWAETHTGPCEDMDTQSCVGFHKVKPDLCSEPTFYETMCKRFCGQCPVKCYSCPHPVRNPSDCNTTTTCGPNMLCMTKRLTATDGHLEYLMTCETKEVCDLLTDGFGKRANRDTPSDSFEHPARSDRAVTLECCNRDGCNAELQTTTAATTTADPATTTTTHRPPTTTRFCDSDNCVVGTTRQNGQTTSTHTGSCYKDVVFAVEGGRGTETMYLINFMKQIVSLIEVLPTQAQVGFVENTKIAWPLDKYQSNQDLLEGLKPYLHATRGLPGPGPHHIHSEPAPSTGLAHTLTQAAHMFTDDGGDRPQAGNVVVVMTTGNSAYHETVGVVNAANRLHAVSPDVVAISFGNVPMPRVIPTDGYHAFTAPIVQNTASDVLNMRTILQNVVNIICA